MAVEIHPSAIIDPTAELADGVKIGAYCVVGKDVKIGAGTVLHPLAQVMERSVVGCNNQIFPNAIIGGAPQDVSYKDEPTYVRIGDNNVIREFVTINRGTTKQDGVTIVGNNNMLMAYVHLAHDCRMGNHNVIANLTQLAGHVVVEDYIFSSGSVLVHQFSTIGTRCFLAPGAMVKKDCIPGLMYDGDPAAPRAINLVGLKRHGLEGDALHHVKQAYKILCRGEKAMADAVADLEKQSWSTEPFVAHMIERVKHTVASETSRSNQAH